LERREEQVLPGSKRGKGQGTGGEIAQTMYRHMNKCINNFLKKTEDTPLYLVFSYSCFFDNWR
jgi:hypothetical protein